MICVKHRTQTAVGIKQMYSKFFKIPPKSLIPKWFPDGFLYIPWSCYRGALGAPKNSEINHRSIAPPSLRAQHPGATSSGVAGPANWTLEKWQVRQVPKNGEKKKMAGLVLFQVFDIVLMPSVPSRFVELLAIKPSSTQTSQNCPESRVVWLDCVASHITLICSCLAPLLKQKLCQSRSEVSVIG